MGKLDDISTALGEVVKTMKSSGIKDYETELWGYKITIKELLKPKK